MLRRDPSLSLTRTPRRREWIRFFRSFADLMVTVNGPLNRRAIVLRPTSHWTFFTLPSPRPSTRTPTLDQRQVFPVAAPCARLGGRLALAYLILTPRLTTFGARRPPAGMTGAPGSPTPGTLPGCSSTG